ncbi:hypothetical protein BGZ60DRAFT_416878 [Tricladium varicosporioides]|nr:hypothetical protein BGZ60DRAFT_416878 [Hymenoscyphus varicosporioides]
MQSSVILFISFSSFTRSPLLPLSLNLCTLSRNCRLASSPPPPSPFYLLPHALSPLIPLVKLTPAHITIPYQQIIVITLYPMHDPMRLHSL